MKCHFVFIEMKKILLAVLFSPLLFFACQKKEYNTYIGTYECEVIYHWDSSGVNIDTSYAEMAEIVEKDDKHMQFRDLPIPYKYISKEGYFADDNFIPGYIWGRQITLRNDSLIYLHHEAGADHSWSIRYKGKRL